MHIVQLPVYTVPREMDRSFAIEVYLTPAALVIEIDDTFF